MKKVGDVIRVIAAVLIIVLIFVSIGFVIIKTVDNDRKLINRYNHGYCSCGGRWELSSAKTKGLFNNSTDYLFICDKCGEMLLIDERLINKLGENE